MKITPRPNYYLVKQVVEEQKKGVLIVPNAKGQQTIYEIIEVGYNDDKEAFVNPQADIGKRVIIKTYSGQEIDIDNQKYTLVEEKEILAVLSE